MSSMISVDQIQKICATGGGTMGFGTVLNFAVAGFEVHFYARRQESLDQSMENMRIALKEYGEHGLIDPADIPAILAKVHPTTNLREAAKDADFVIESIAEDLAVKQQHFQELEEICPAHTIFATNTSALSPTKIANALKHPERFVVTHFWNPPHLLPLVEIVPGEKTSPETIETAHQLITMIGKKPVRMKKELDGFIGNRLQAALYAEAAKIIDGGFASPEDVDTVVKYSIGRRLAATGPIESGDMTGLDVFASIFQTLAEKPRPSRVPRMVQKIFQKLAGVSENPAIPPLLAATLAQGHLGMKSGQGIYSWSPEKSAAMRGQRVGLLYKHLRNDAFGPFRHDPNALKPRGSFLTCHK